MFPKELESILDEHDGHYDLYIAKADYSGDNFIIDFVVDADDFEGENHIIQKWTIIVSGHKKDRISFDFAPLMEIKDEHPLLWEFTDTTTQLYFNGQCKNIGELFYDLHQTHKEIFGGHQCFDLEVFHKGYSYKPFQYSNGLLAKGAKTLMEKYAACLTKNGLGFSMVGEWPPQCKGSKVLLMGDTYIVAEDFSFVRQAEEDRC